MALFQSELAICDFLRLLQKAKHPYIQIRTVLLQQLHAQCKLKEGTCA